MGFFEQTTIICDNCNKKAEKKIIIKDGFKMRGWQCPLCKKVWPHPLDEEQFGEFQKLRQKDFQVKLRMVGNSWTISIPKEIIKFENLAKEMNRTTMIHLDGPNRISIMFKKEIAKLIKTGED